MKKYFLYELKKNAYAVGFITFSAAALYLTILLSDNYLGYNSHSIYLWIIAMTGGVLAVVVPVWMFSYRMKKRSVDLYYSLPLSHTKILAVKYLVGLLAVFVPYTVTYWLGAFTVMIKSHYNIFPVYYLAHFFSSLIPLYIIYALSAFAFTRANKRNDGFMFIIFMSGALFIVLNVLEMFVIDKWENLIEGVILQSYIYSEHFTPFSPLSVVTTVFQGFIAGEGEYTLSGFPRVELINFYVGSVLNTLLAIATTCGIFFFEQRAKAENAEQISDSIFGYKVMLPLYTLCLTALSLLSVILVLLVAIGSYCIAARYKRSLKIGKKQALILVATLAAGIIISIIRIYI